MNRAAIAKQKAEGIAQADTEESLAWRIVRLQEINAILTEVQKVRLVFLNLPDLRFQ